MPEDDTGIVRSELRDSRQGTGIQMRWQANVRAGEAPAIVIDEGGVGGAFFTPELAAEFEKQQGRPRANLFRHDGRGI